MHGCNVSPAYRSARATRLQSFQDLSNSVAAQAMRKELDKLVSKVQDAEKRKVLVSGESLDVTAD